MPSEAPLNRDQRMDDKQGTCVTDGEDVPSRSVKGVLRDPWFEVAISELEAFSD